MTSMHTTQPFSVNYLCDKNQASKKQRSQIYEFNKVMKTDYGFVQGPEPHTYRRKQILQKHPEIAQLLVPSKPYSMILAPIIIILSMVVTYLVKDSSWPVYLATLYVVNGTLAHTLHVLIHDFTHTSGHPNKTVNMVMAVLCNIPMGFPSALSFAKYHTYHHNFLGEQKKDPDIPFEIQSKLSKYVVYKIFFYSILSIFYAFRPFACYHRKMNLGETINFIFIAFTDFLVYKYWGPSALLYLLLVTFVSIGPHPAAIHALAQHFQFVEGLQTYSYIGIWNIPNLNVGYHTEHHDFPTCPWYNLPKIREIAHEFYDYLPVHTSYIKLLIKFLFDKNFTLYNWVIRINKKE